MQLQLSQHNLSSQAKQSGELIVVQSSNNFLWNLSYHSCNLLFRSLLDTDLVLNFITAKLYSRV